MKTNRYQVTIHIRTERGISHTLYPIIEALNSTDAIRIIKATYQNITFMGSTRKLD